MKRIRRLVRDIGEAINACARVGRPVALGAERGSRMKTSLDTIVHTALALQYVQEEGLGRTSRHLGPARQYLHAYGCMQAVFVQQDAVRDLWNLLTDTELDTGALPVWNELREWRNRLVGHPTGRGKGAAVIRTTFALFLTSSKGFAAFAWHPGRGIHERKSFVAADLVTQLANETEPLMRALLKTIDSRKGV